MSIALKIQATCIGFVAIIVLLAVLAQQQVAALSRMAVSIYDHAFVGMSYVDLADEAYLRLSERVGSISGSKDTAAVRADAKIVLDQLDVAIERAQSDRTRKLGASTLEVMRAATRLPPADMLQRLPELDHAMNRLVARYSADGLAARDAAGALADRDRLLLVVEAMAAIVSAAVLGFAVARNLSPPLNAVVAAIKAFTKGEPGHALSERLLVRRDEIGEVARATVMFGETMRRNVQLAHYDTLTGLANRKLFGERLAQALAMGERTNSAVALLCLDLDRFKIVNDTLGHPAGDRLLCEVGARLQSLLRDIDTAARLGGDEFVVIQQMVGDPSAAATLSERIIAELSLPYDIGGQQVVIGASVGIALYSSGVSDAEALMRSADMALYRAKQDGRGVYRFFEPGMDAGLANRRELEADLRTACARGELELYYQPVCQALSLEVLGMEALLRWNHPTRGQIPPMDFIPIAEDSRLILPIGRWAIDTACRTAAAWSDDRRIAVNLSPVQFGDPDLVATVTAALCEYNLDPARLELEITENVLIDDSERVLDILLQLKAAGVRIVLDDFGTGYSSLSYLRRFPFDKIKIDRSFVHGLGNDPEADTLVACIVALSHSLALEVTAEGVETQQQVDLLRSFGCDYCQGFLLGRPAATPPASRQTKRVPKTLLRAAALTHAVNS